MKEIRFVNFYEGLVQRKMRFPFSGQIELSYRCNLCCVHCYCQGLEKTGEAASSASRATDIRKQSLYSTELTTVQWKKVFDEIQKAGCLWLTFTGGDPLVREDFLELYSYAKIKGFIITIFTNAQGLTKDVIDCFAKSPPYSIEITLNGISEAVYEAITQVKGSFSKAIENIKKLKEKNLKIILKSNCLKTNKNEIGKIKAFAQGLLGRPLDNKYHFKYGLLIWPHLNGSHGPCDYRLSFKELLQAQAQDADIWEESQRILRCDFPELKREKAFLYHCNSWLEGFFINPCGRLKFCEFSEKFSADIKAASFSEWFYGLEEKILSEKFKTVSVCRDCNLRSVCYCCPARAYLETGNEEGPVEYYCQLAKGAADEMQKAKTT